MKVILKESYMNLGEAGDQVNVKPGFARNFLIPQKIAVSATPANLKFFADKAKELEAKKLNEREKSKKTMDQLKGVSLLMKVRASDEGKLFGSITSREIEAELLKRGAQVDRRQIILNKPIKMVGEYLAMVRLVGNMTAEVPVKVESDAPTAQEIADDDEQQQSSRAKKGAEEKLKKETAKN